MRNRMPHYLAIGLLMPACGCAVLFPDGFGQREPRQTMMMSVARSNHITMFGELEDGSTEQYESRYSASLRQHSFTEVGDDTDPDIDVSGEWMVFASTRHHHNADVYLKSIQGVSVTQLTSDPAADVQPSFSPDGSRIAFASNRGGSWDIWVKSLDGGQPSQVTDDPGDEVHPSWSPDGTRLVYSRLPLAGGPWELWVADAIAGGTRKFIGYGLFPEWSPAGETIVYQRARERGGKLFSVWTLTLVDGEPRYPTEVAGGGRMAAITPTWNADGSAIAYSATEFPVVADESTPPAAPTFDVWMVRADGFGKVRLTEGTSTNVNPTFAPDGRLYFTSDRTGMDNVWSVLPMSGIASPGGASSATAAGPAGVPSAAVTSNERAARKTVVSDKSTSHN